MLRPVLTVAAALALAACSAEPEVATDEIHTGPPAELGAGTVWTYTTVDAAGNLTALGARFDAAVLEDLPAEPDGTAPCFDLNGDGSLDPHAECFMMIRRNLALPAAAAAAAAPFRYLQLNWNPEGHAPPAPPAYAAAHIDFHFFATPQADVETLRPGRCGFLMDCEAFERAVIPVPERYMPRGYVAVDAAAAEEGNHLIDPASPELADPPAPFTHTFIYGSYDGHITFYEPMIAVSYLAGRPHECVDLKLPEAWETAGVYPTRYCIRYLAEAAEYTVSLEGFVRREAT